MKQKLLIVFVLCNVTVFASQSPSQQSGKPASPSGLSRSEGALTPTKTAAAKLFVPAAIITLSHENHFAQEANQPTPEQPRHEQLRHVTMKELAESMGLKNFIAEMDERFDRARESDID